jgi:hypothetical protein
MERPLVLLVNESRSHERGVAGLLSRLGYEPYVCELRADTAQAFVTSADPAAALVAPLPEPAIALDVIGAIAHQTSCPVVALARTYDRAYAREAATRGAYGLARYDPDDIDAALATARSRNGDYLRLLDAFERRATIEQAKGLLMARHSVDPHRAFTMLKRHSQRTNTKLTDVAQALVRSHLLLLQGKRQPTPERGARVPHNRAV